MALAASAVILASRRVAFALALTPRTMVIMKPRDAHRAVPWLGMSGSPNCHKAYVSSLSVIQGTSEQANSASVVARPQTAV